MRYCFYCFIVLFLIIGNVFAQKQTALPHGMVYGSKPSTVGLVPAWQIETLMGKRTRISAALSGKVLKVTKPKGGWFTLDAGKGRTISVRFKNYNITLPTALKGREVIISGVVSKQFIADDQQPFAGDTVIGKKQHKIKTNPRQCLIFEVDGLMVNK